MVVRPATMGCRRSHNPWIFKKLMRIGGASCSHETRWATNPLRPPPAVRELRKIHLIRFESSSGIFGSTRTD
jgi:hypothetical protein